ncbi:MAG: macro domain-containing protein [Chloroflexaceae bacterium]
MERSQIGLATLELVRGDIVTQDVDAIVNAANEGLAEGGGVCGAIFRAAGSQELAAACRPLAPCPTGEARITPGFRLRARHIIHAVGPVYRRDDPDGSARLLAAAYSSSLALAARHGLSSVAFPSISTGIFGYPVEDAARVALAAVRDALAAGGSVTLVRFVLWDEGSLAAYRDAAQALGLAPA